MELDSSSSSIGLDGDGDWDILAEHLEEEPSPGDVIWIKLSGGSWWPAVVVNENSVSGINKPKFKPKGNILVRTYGSYKYLYVDHIKCHSELQILKHRNGDYLDVLKEAMKQQLSSWISGTTEEQELRPRDKAKSTNRSQIKQGRGNSKHNGGEVGGKPSQQNGAKKKLKFDSPNASENSKIRSSSRVSNGRKLLEHDSDLQIIDFSTRRMKVMQNLGLTAPSGSPFSRNGHA